MDRVAVQRRSRGVALLAPALGIVMAGLVLGSGIEVPAASRPTPVDRANALLAQMTRDEKISLAANGAMGVPRLGIPGLAPTDGPNGVRMAAPGATAFPTAEIVAASWDQSL